MSELDYYRNKTVLITGATGFVGKIILWQLMNTVGHVIDKVYVLIRPKRIPGGIPSQRLIDEIINNNVKRFFSFIFRISIYKLNLGF